MSGEAITARAPGRPRRFDPDTELRLIMDAAEKLLRENEYDDVTVGGILAESGLSTRSFYRHFTSKDELFIGLYRQHGARLTEMIQAKVDEAGSPREGLRAWVYEMLRLRFDTRVARRVAMYSAPGAQRAVGDSDAGRRAAQLMIGPLLGVLEAGLADGSFPTARPGPDGRTIYALAWDVIRWERDTLTREEAVDHVLRFALAALGAT